MRTYHGTTIPVDYQGGIDTFGLRKSDGAESLKEL
jgi:hypothetical protein